MENDDTLKLNEEVDIDWLNHKLFLYQQENQELKIKLDKYIYGKTENEFEQLKRQNEQLQQRNTELLLENRKLKQETPNQKIGNIEFELYFRDSTDKWVLELNYDFLQTCGVAKYPHKNKDAAIFMGIAGIVRDLLDSKWNYDNMEKLQNEDN